MYKPEYIEAIQKEKNSLRAENKTVSQYLKISIALNIALIISIIILGQQIEKLSGIITGL